MKRKRYNFGAAVEEHRRLAETAARDAKRHAAATKKHARAGNCYEALTSLAAMFLAHGERETELYHADRRTAINSHRYEGVLRTFHTHCFTGELPSAWR